MLNIQLIGDVELLGVVTQVAAAPVPDCKQRL
jgi:hypothetical protein